MISVVVPTYNHGAYVLETLKSIRDQWFQDFEVIVVNDGSADNTAEVLQPYAKSGWMRYIEQANAGQAAARNRGLAEARGEYIAFIDDDDIWPPDKLQWQMKLARQCPSAVGVYGYCESFPAQQLCRPADGMPQGLIREQLLEGNWIISPGQTLLRSDLVRQIGGFDESIKGADDWDLLIRLAGIGPFVYGHRLALKYRIHASNASRDAWAMFRGARQVQRKHLGALPGFRNWRQWIRLRNRVGHHYARLLLEQAWQSERPCAIGLKVRLQIAFMYPRATVTAIARQG